MCIRNVVACERAYLRMLSLVHVLHCRVYVSVCESMCIDADAKFEIFNLNEFSLCQTS